MPRRYYTVRAPRRPNRRRGSIYGNIPRETIRLLLNMGRLRSVGGTTRSGRRYEMLRRVRLTPAPLRVRPGTVMRSGGIRGYRAGRSIAQVRGRPGVFVYRRARRRVYNAPAFSYTRAGYGEVLNRRGRRLGFSRRLGYVLRARPRRRKYRSTFVTERYRRRRNIPRSRALSVIRIGRSRGRTIAYR